MAQGFLSGVIWGAVTSVGAAAVASLVAGTAPQPELGTTPAAAPAPSVTEGPAADPSPDADVASAASVPGPAPEAEVSALDPAVTQSVPRPETGEASDLSAPAPQEEGTDVASDVANAPLPLPTAPVAPAAPGTSEELSISTDPAQPQAPDAQAGGAFDAPAPEDEALGSVDVAPEAEAPAEAEVAPPPETPDVAPAPTQPVFPTITAEDDAQDLRPTIGTPAGSLVDRTPTLDRVRAIDQFAADVPETDGKPLMSVVLIDDGTAPSSGPIGLAALDSFPYPLTFAISASLPDAAERAAAYRAQGHEVLAMTDIPEGATAADVEVSLAAALGAVPEAVGVLEGTETGLQTSREISDQATAILAASGHGLVMQANGLNTAQKLAVRDGVPAAPVFRDFDSAGQTPTVIRRFLDQAAFRAGQEQGVVMLGRVRADTISALLLWGLQDRATRVALVPISAVLNAQVAEAQ
ncbi:MAG: divergent polysaccharide deacetylase family protein [Pseudomonadota bacterium]